MSASDRSKDISLGCDANYSTTGEASPKTVTVPVPFSAVKGIATETGSAGTSAAVEDVAAAETVVATVFVGRWKSSSPFPEEQDAAARARIAAVDLPSFPRPQS